MIYLPHMLDFYFVPWQIQGTINKKFDQKEVGFKWAQNDLAVYAALNPNKHTTSWF